MTKPIFTINGETENLWELVVYQGKSLSQKNYDQLVALGEQLYRKKSIKERLLKRFKSFMERLTPKDND